MASGLENIETIESPFRRFVTTIGVFPTAFTDAMTYYECLAYLVKYIEDTVIPAVNENAEALEELQRYYTQLKSYVDNYFADLDVQEEINNKLDQMAEDGTLQEIVSSYIQANVTWTFDTVADMKSATNLVNGSYAQTLGFHSINDGGGAIYKITNTGTANEQDIIAVDSLLAVLHPVDHVTPEMFGAYGDGTTDDSTAINACIAYAHTNELPAKMLGKDYGIASPIVINGGNSEFSFGANVSGDSIGGSTIHVLDTITDAIQISAIGTPIDVHNIILANFSINGHNKATNGINIKYNMASSTFDGIYIHSCTGSGILQTNANVFLNNFNKIRCERCDIGISLRTNINTSNNFVSCYMVNCRIGYSIKSIYSDLLNCCADGITETVFDMYYYSGNIINPGAESRNATTVFDFVNSTATVTGANTFGNFTNASAIHIKCRNRSNVTFDGCKLLTYMGEIYNDGTHIAPGYLYQCSSYGKLRMINCQYCDYQLDNASNEHTDIVTLDNGQGQIAISTGKAVSFIGRNTLLSDGLVNPACKGSTLTSNALFLGLGDSVRYTANGTDLRWTRHTMRGDILLSQNPKNIGGIGWIQGDDPATPTSGWETGTYLKIPVIHSGSTADRPTTSLVVGQMYFDTTLNKPIWFKGSNTWVDATGTTV